MLAIEKLPEIMEIRTPVKFAFCFVKKYFRHFDQWSSRLHYFSDDLCFALT
jgi:hypothetical protein